jgi:membrane-associated protease RseP (regulator of RpoE activity)
VHELGHLLGGKMVGIKARVFSMGYGKGVLKKKIGDTTIRSHLSLLGATASFTEMIHPKRERAKALNFFQPIRLKELSQLLWARCSILSSV